MEKARYRFEVFYTSEDPRGKALARRFERIDCRLDALVVIDNYLIDVPIDEERAMASDALLINPVTQSFLMNSPSLPGKFDQAIEIGYLPGVTDNVASTVRESLIDFLKLDADVPVRVFSSVSYYLFGITRERALDCAAELYNPLIQRMTILDYESYGASGGFGSWMPLVRGASGHETIEIDLDVSDEELAVIGRQGIPDGDGTRRGPLALDLVSMGVIKNYFIEQEKRKPTDIELESIAQTWSEHCKHTIFAASLDGDVPEGIFKKYIREATVRIRREMGERDICRSVFSDNAGGIVFDENYIIADKVETHNSPSALDPFGGAITGIVGVNRDALGFGMASKPVANRYGFCFGRPDDERPLYKAKDPKSRMLSPRRIMEGVIQGVNAGGNTSGIPTPQGFIYFDDRYRGKPLVFVGTIGLLPTMVNGAQAVHKKAMPGDLIVMAGGRVGRDGIHGATFSSEALGEGSPATAVQIGDPITQKKMSDAIVKEARDLGLYHSITDNGAGGLSCSVAEMARECGGFSVQLDLVPLKYPGLSPWQIWVSESQERMTLAVPPHHAEAFLDLMKRRGVEATVIGTFNESSRGIVTFNGDTIYNLDMTFLHEGLPQKKLKTRLTRRDLTYKPFDVPADPAGILLSLLGRLNIASFEFISTQYDHEVQGSSIIKPLQGPGRVNGNATVIRPVLDSPRGVVMTQSLFPSYSEIDPYNMAANSIDTAVRNCVAVGGTLQHLAILDNFCWTDSNNPERLGELKEAARACYDVAVAYGTPFISGKDSMFNDFNGFDEDFNPVSIAIPPTLLISAMGVIESCDICQTIDYKNEGETIYCIGSGSSILGGSEYLAMMGEQIQGSPFFGDSLPAVFPGQFAAQYKIVETALRKGIVTSSSSVERGGVATAVMKSAMAGLMGAVIDFRALSGPTNLRPDAVLFSEGGGRILLTVRRGSESDFELIAGSADCRRIGTTGGNSVIFNGYPGGSFSVSISKALAKYREFSDAHGGGGR